MVEFRRLKLGCMARGVIYEDPLFPTTWASLYLTRRQDTSITWRRPREISDDPKFIVDGISRFDLDQGDLGNCWFVAAASLLATKPALFRKVVPPDQDFGGRYCGIFRFYFWRFGQWTEVVIDDRLPVQYGTNLVFSRNKHHPNEFWCALLEKAYAKLHGSYEALGGGKIQDALVDFTGGISETISLQPEPPKRLFGLLIKLDKRNLLIGCSIPTSDGSVSIQNGLWRGHSYAITALRKFAIVGLPKKVRLLRLKDPFGRDSWKGAWSDGSPEWGLLPEAALEQLDIVTQEDGEFWMSYEDWKKNFTEIQICHMTSQSASMHTRKKRWKMECKHGKWTKNVTAGGCGNPPNEDLYWTNPQYLFRLQEPDHHDEEKKCTVVASLSQKDRRSLRNHLRTQDANLAMGMDVYKVTDKDQKSNSRPFNKNSLVLQSRSNSYSFYREITLRMSLPPGDYVIIPSTFNPNVTADFFLRILTEKRIGLWEMDESSLPPLILSEGMRRVSSMSADESGHNSLNDSMDTEGMEEVLNGDTSFEPQSDVDLAMEELAELFTQHCGEDGVADARDVHHILHHYKHEGQPLSDMSLETCRNLVAFMDMEKMGSLKCEQLLQLWQEVITWQDAYKQLVGNIAEDMKSTDLREAFHLLHFNINRKAVASLLSRYAGKRDVITYDDFLSCVARFTIAYEAFLHHSSNDTGVARINLEEWLEETLRL